MGRAIISYAKRKDAFPELVDGSPRNPPPPPEDAYRDRLLKYIPAEVVAFYLGLAAIVAAAANVPGFLHWLIFAVGVAATPFYLLFYQKVTAPTQLIISTLAFIVWIFALGGPFTDFAWYKQVYGAVLLPVFTFVVAGISPAPKTPV